MTTAKQIKDRAESAVRRFETDRGKLYRGDGEPRYGDVEMRERLAGLRSERNEALDKIEAEADSAREEATNELAALEHGGLAAWLTPDELERASARHTLVAADVGGLSLPELGERLSAVSLLTDRSTQASYYLAARARPKGEVGASVFLEDLREAIIPASYRQKVQDARDSLADLLEIKGIVYLARREQSSAYVPNYSVSAG